MKKKLLLLILLLIPFIVKAEDKSNYSLTWLKEEEKEYYEYYETEDSFILTSKNSLKLINIFTGEEKVINYNKGLSVRDDNYIYLVEEKSDSVLIHKYDLDLNQIKEEELSYFNIDYFTCYYNGDTKECEISGNRLVNNDYYRVIYVFDMNLVNKYYSEKKTIQKTSPYNPEFYVPSQILFADNNRNIYIWSDDEIYPMNSDENSYIYLEGMTLYRKSLDGEVLDTLTIPEGSKPRVAYDYDYIYIAIANYTSIGNKYYISIKIYKIDEELNIIQEKTITPPNTKYFTRLPNEDEWDYDISYNGFNLQVIVDYDEEKNYYSTDSVVGYRFDSNLNYITLERPSLLFEPIELRHSLNSVPIFNNYSDNYYNQLNTIDSLPDNIKDNLYEKIISNNYLVNYKYSFTEDTIAVLLETYDETEISNAQIITDKLTLFYYDYDLNEISNTELYETNINKSEIDNHIPIVYYIERIDNDFVVGVNYKNNENILRLYDDKGNLIQDYSNKVNKYNNLFITGIKTTPKGFWVKYDSAIFIKYQSKGVSLDLTTNESIPSKVLAVYSPIYRDRWVLPEEIDGTNTALLYFAKNFIINTKVNGEGTITSNVKEAEEGTVVEFTVTPKPGYVLDSVKVIDSTGNVLTFTDYTFTMPNANVTIEATFVKIKNPNTGNIAIISIAFLATISGIFVIFQKKKLNFLK